MKSKQLLLHLFLALVAASALSFLKLDYIESYLYDLRVSVQSALGLSEPKKTPLVLVTINSKTVEKLKGFPTYSVHADFLKKMTASGASHIIYDFRIKDGEIRDIEGDLITKKEFAETALKIKNFYIPTEELELTEEDF